MVGQLKAGPASARSPLFTSAGDATISRERVTSSGFKGTLYLDYGSHIAGTSHPLLEAA